MLPFPASDRAQARPGGNDDGSFFFPLPSPKKGDVTPHRKARRVSREARERGRQTAWLFGFGSARGAEASANRGQQPRARRGSTARRRARASVTCCRNR